MKTVELVKKVCAEFEIKTPTASKLNGQLMDSLINVTKSATTSMYGIVLKRTGDMLKLEQNNDFAPRGKVVVGKPSL
jgi:hypothetical protein